MAVEDFLRVYLSTRRGHAHLVRYKANGEPNLYETLCGQVSAIGFHGTGSNREREEVHRRRLCRTCDKIGGALEG